MQLPTKADFRGWGIRTLWDWQKDWARITDQYKWLGTLQVVVLVMTVLSLFAGVIAYGEFRSGLTTTVKLLAIVWSFVVLGVFCWIMVATRFLLVTAEYFLDRLSEETNRGICAWGVVSLTDLPGKVVVLVYRPNSVSWGIVPTGVPILVKLLELLKGRVVVFEPKTADRIALENLRGVIAPLIAQMGNAIGDQYITLPPREFYAEISAEIGRLVLPKT